MPASLPTLQDLREQLLHARTELIVAEDVGDPAGAALARLRCDAILDRILLLSHVDV